MSAKKSVEEKKQSARLWRQRNKEYLKEWKRKWYEKNYKNNLEYKAHIKKYAKENLVKIRIRDRNRYKNDPFFRMRKILRAQVTYSIKRGFKLGQKCAPTLKLLDIHSIDWFWKYIQSKLNLG
jgi:cellulose biosynthesis protein BcsQ